jgi:hypothetical protein
LLGEVKHSIQDLAELLPLLHNAAPAGESTVNENPASRVASGATPSLRSP